MLRVRLLGELQADVDGAPVAPPASRRAWSLLAWLALHPGEHARGAVAARFWPDVLDTSARASLRSALWELRRALGTDEPLVTGRERIALRGGDRPRRVRGARRRRPAGGRRRAAPRPAARRARRGLGARGARRARGAARLGATPGSPRPPPRPPTPSRWARRRLQLDPLDEDAARELMRRMAAAGDRAGALAAYDRLSDRLRESLGLAPSQQTRALAASLREAEAPAARRAATGPPLIGRDAELDTLAGVWEQVRSGHGAVVVLGGEGGIGKTRLAAELLARARAGNAPRRALQRRRGLRRRSRPGSSCWRRSPASSIRRPPTPAGRRSSAAWRRRSRAASAAPTARPPTSPASSPARACSRPPSSSPSTPPPTARSCCCSTTSTSPTRRRWSSPPTSPAASRRCRCCSILTRRMTPRRDEVDALLHAAARPRRAGARARAAAAQPRPARGAGRRGRPRSTRPPASG